MKKFRFRFETVLNVRKRREEEALRALTSAQRAYQAELGRKAELLRSLHDAFKRHETLGQDPVQVTAFRVEDDFIVGTKHRIAQTDQAIVRASRAVEKVLRLFLLARKQRRIMELIYEKEYESFKKARSKKEARDMDELMIMRARFKEASS